MSELEDISADRFTDGWLICQHIQRRQSGKQLAEMGLISASRFTDYQLICQQIWREWSENMLTEMGVGVYVLADLLTVC